MTDIADFTPPGWLDIEGGINPDTDGAWRIRSDREAGWALRKIRSKLDELDRLKATAAEEIDRIKAWLDQATGTLEGDIAFFEHALVEYRHMLEEHNPALPKTYKLPDGTISRRSVPAAIDVTDPDALIAWAIKNERRDLLRIEPAKSMLKDLLEHAPHEDGDSGWQLVTSDGEIVPGVEYVAQEDRYGAKPA